jgi:hypothetical protein
MAAGDGGYAIVEDVSMSLARANVIGSAAAVPAIVVLLAVFWVAAPHVAGQVVSVRLGGLAGVLLASLPGILLHEAIHGAAWRVLGRQGPGQVRFGFHRQTLTPYAHSLAPMSAWVYRAGAGLPAVLLGVGPYVAGILLGSFAVSVFGALFVVAASGDLLVLWLLRSVRGDALVLDHPSRAGCLVVRRVSEGEGQAA